MKKKLGSILSITIALILIVGISYAYFVYNARGKNEIIFNGGKIDIAFTNKSEDQMLVTGLYPKTDKDGLIEGVSYNFTLTGYNESAKDMHYRIYMDDTETTPEDKVRFSDNLIKVAVYKNNELVLPPSEIGDFSNPGIYFDVIKQGSSAQTPEVNNYEVKLWISDKVRITSTLCEEGYTCFSQEEYPKMFFEKVLKIEADFSYDDIGYLNYNANGGSYTPKKTSLVTQKVTSQKPVLENKAFLGWSSTPDGEVEYKSGDTYTGKGVMLYAIYTDTRNVMNTFPTAITDHKANITNVYFINDDMDTLTTRYNNASIKADLTYNNQGKVLGWLENDNVIDGTQYYNLYIGSEGVTYLNTGYQLFMNFTNLTTIDFTNVDTSMVTSIAYMFSNGEWINSVFTNVNKSLINLDLSSFNTCNVKSLYQTFFGLIALESLNLTNFNTASVTSMFATFYYCSSLNNLDITNFDTSKVTDMYGMFYNCGRLINLDLSNFNTREVTNMYAMFHGCSSLNVLDLSSFDTSKVTNISNMFSNCYELKIVDLSNFDTSNVVNMEAMFYNCESLTELDVSNFDTSNVTNMKYMFCNCYELKIVDISTFDTRNVINMSGMFYNCESLTELNVSNFNTSNVTNMKYMFCNCLILTNLDLSNLDTKNVTNMEYMFHGNEKLKELDLSSFNTSNVTNMNYMFYNCESLTELDVSNFDTINIISMAGMFYGCISLTKLDLSSFNTINVTDMNRMFCNCYELKIVDISTFDTRNVINMSGMFYNCESLTELDVSNFNTSNVTNMEYMFCNCLILTNLDLSNLDTKNVTNMKYMFHGNEKLKELDLSSFNTINVTDTGMMFYGCSNLETICTNGDWNIEGKNIESSYMFSDCNKLSGKVAYDSTKVDISMANFDGYFTKKQTA